MSDFIDDLAFLTPDQKDTIRNMGLDSPLTLYLQVKDNKKILKYLGEIDTDKLVRALKKQIEKQ